MRIFATDMQQDSLPYRQQNIVQPNNVHQVIPLLGPVKSMLPDSLQQGIPPYADPHSKPTDSIYARLELNQFYWTYDQAASKSKFKLRPVHTEKSIFTSTQLKAVNVEPALINDQGFNWLTGILVMCFVIYTVTQFLYSKRLRQIFKAALARRYVSQLIREGELFRERITIGLLFIFFFTAATFIFQDIRYVLNIDLAYPGLTYFSILTGLFVFWLIKVSAIRFLGFVFKNQSSAYEYNLTSLIYLEIIGLILLPLSLPAIFQDPQLFSKIGLIVILTGLLINLIRGFLVGLYNTKFSIFYLILYLCTLEILPLIVVVKIFINH
ncbi:MAG: DUF4271 domain-containing protein [Bacteroidota bacterium]|nr:DUF4271 domain-containing protein [Bacteroidota bacterium]